MFSICRIAWHESLMQLNEQNTQALLDKTVLLVKECFRWAPSTIDNTQYRRHSVTAHKSGTRQNIGSCYIC